MADLNEHGADMAQIGPGAVVRFENGERGRVVRMDLPRLGRIDLLDEAGRQTGDRTIFHSLNVVAVDQARTDSTRNPAGPIQ